MRVSLPIWACSDKQNEQNMDSSKNPMLDVGSEILISEIASYQEYGISAD